jgi:endonuclease-3 related protein
MVKWTRKVTDTLKTSLISCIKMPITEIQNIYKILYGYYGDLGWWPADTAFEVMVGAVLTQNTAWRNVEKALGRFEGRLSPELLMDLSVEELEDIIKPAGFYRQKSKYLKELTRWFMSYHSDIGLIKKHSLPDIRSELLHVKGVGNETADSILLYALDLPSFVVDAYTRRLFERIPIEAGKAYGEIKSFCESELDRDPEIYKSFHAFIVQNGKDHCRKKPICRGCPLEEMCKGAEGTY